MKNLTFLFCIFMSHLLTPLMGYEYELSILAIFRNEADYLKEWIDYHHRIGVEHFILYNHFSDDNYKKVLQPYIDKKLVELHNIKQVEYPAALLSAYQYGLKKCKKSTKWVALIDIDEFIVPIINDDLRTFLRDYEDYAGVVMNWQLFGTSDIQSLPQGEWITKHLIYKFPVFFDDPTWNSNKFIKCIIRPDRINENSTNHNCGNHTFEPISGYELVNSGKIPQKLVCKVKDILVDKIQLNHYWFRTMDWFYNHKLHRRGVVGEIYTPEKIEYLFEQGRSEIDLQIQRFLD